LVEFERQEGREAYHRSPPDRGDVALKAPNMLEVVNLNRRFSWGEAIDTLCQNAVPVRQLEVSICAKDLAVYPALHNSSYSISHL